MEPELIAILGRLVALAMVSLGAVGIGFGAWAVIQVRKTRSSPELGGVADSLGSLRESVDGLRRAVDGLRYDVADIVDRIESTERRLGRLTGGPAEADPRRSPPQ